MAVKRRLSNDSRSSRSTKSSRKSVKSKDTKLTNKKRASKVEKVEEVEDVEIEYESLKEAKPEAERAEVFKLDDKKQKKRIGFPLNTPDGAVAMVKVVYFKVKFGSTLADGKWHAFQAPVHNPELLEACRKHPLLDEKTDRATIVIVYDTDSKGKVYGKGTDIGYELLAMKINNPKLLELQDIDEDDDLTSVDLIVTLDKAKDVKFQDMRFKTAGDALWSGEMDTKEIQDEAKALSKKLKDVIAYEYSDEKIEALIGDGDDEDDYDDYDDEDYDDYDEDYDDYEIDGDEEDEEDEEEEEAPRRGRKAPARRRARR